MTKTSAEQAQHGAVELAKLMESTLQESQRWPNKLKIGRLWQANLKA